MPDGTHVTIGLGKVAIEPSVNVKFPPEATGASEAEGEYKSSKPHVRMTYDRSIFERT
jgi:hypothetical protein